MRRRGAWSPTAIACAGALAVGLGGHSAEAQRAEARGIDRERIAAALARYRDEPSVDDVVRAVIESRALDPARASEAAERARLAGIVPQARADVRRGQMLDLRALQSGTTDRSTWTSGDEIAFSAGLTFRLDRLVFAADETALLRERRQLEERRLALVTQAVHVYFERRRLQLERDLAGTSEVATEMRIAEAEALLDVFTNGAFSRMMSDATTRRAHPLGRDDRDEGP
jgi:hypothetical protein